jgi:hypothetical protein
VTAPLLRDYQQESVARVRAAYGKHEAKLRIVASVSGYKPEWIYYRMKDFAERQARGAA